MVAPSEFFARSPPHSVSGEEVLAALASDAGRGLTQAEARARLDRFGANVLTAEKPVPAWRKFLAQFQDVLVVLLLDRHGDFGSAVVRRARRGVAV